MLKWFCFCNLSQLSLTLSPARSCSLPLAPARSPVSTLSSQLSEVFWSHYHSQTFTPDNLSGREPVLCTVQGTLVMIRGVGACLQWKYLFLPIRSNRCIFLPVCYKTSALSMRFWSQENLPHTVWEQLWDNPVRTLTWLAKGSGGIQVAFHKPQIPFQKHCTMHSEPALDNPVPQCSIQTATSLLSVAYCYHRLKTHLVPNPHLAASSIKHRARETGSETMATNARWMGALDVPSYLCPSPSLPHLYPPPPPLPPFFVHIWWWKMQTCSPGTLSQWDTKVSSSQAKLHAVHKQQL